MVLSIYNSFIRRILANDNGKIDQTCDDTKIIFIFRYKME